METFSEKDIIVFDNFFSSNECEIIHEYLSQPRWAFGHGSTPDRDGTPFWVMNLNDSNFFTSHLLNIIQEKTKSKFLLERVYANGHTFGTQGDIHKDSFHSNGRTFLYYANPEWNVEWSGKTVFLLNSNEQKYVLPQPNRAVLFPGVIPHYAEQITRKFTGLRITIAWKLHLEV